MHKNKTRVGATRISVIDAARFSAELSDFT
jgi:hypothetical protein